ncbi:MAG: hypothetical protein DLM67_21095 [Candidatus Nephthysia bennettiae]|uniref:Tyr recombinase domain-containing protein n=1 Tax=Candidatus Nephthysia bennettiae TaxID=3127016 RepID=A0A934NA29_9BACT|nr:hypothetical protein [Candidatus Dormibacteraeota bacterium]PZR88077.1 MAG: hypothetical protein DLM67_21095 [Candidatus Dormibacteraeota bacterium]
MLKRHVLPRLDRVQIGQLEPRQVNAVMLEARTRGLSVRTCNYIRVTLRAMLSEAQRDGMVGRNAAALVRPFADQREERPLSVLSPGQARVLLEAAHEDREGPLWVLAITTGLRQGELAGLRWQDVDLEARQLQVRRSLQYQNGLGWRPLFALGGRSPGSRPDQHDGRPLHTRVRDSAAGGGRGHGSCAWRKLRSIDP